MHTRYAIGLYIIFFILIRYSTGSSETKNDEDYVEVDYDDEDYYYNYNDKESSTSPQSAPLANNNSASDNETTSLTTTTSKPTTTTTTNTIIVTTNILSDILIALPKYEPKCPDDCDCSDEYQFVDCSNRNLKKVPNDIPENVIRLDLSYNLIDDILDDVFVNCTNIRELLLNGNRISHITKEVFQGLIKLDHINMANNSLTTINSDTFNEASSLTKLDLSYNLIEIPKDDIFLDQPYLKEILLMRCGIKEFYNDTFKNLTDLLSLNLDENNFGMNINFKAFEPLTKLNKLRLVDLDETNIKSLCQVLTSIDLIDFKNFSITCFELVLGTSFEDSKITTSRSVSEIQNNSEKTAEEPQIQKIDQPSNTSPSSTTPPRTKKLRITTENTVENIFESNLTSTLEQQTANNGEDETTEGANKTYQVAISTQAINYILIGIIAVAVVGLIIGIVCRKDICGVKTKLCRTRRPPPTDQVRPAEEMPLNKV